MNEINSKSAWWLWEAFFDLPRKQGRFSELEQEAADPDYWNDAERAQGLERERNQLTDTLKRYRALTTALDDTEALLELAKESSDAELLKECQAELDKLAAGLESFELQRMLTGKHDQLNAILEINPGAGGTEAQDWAEMLLRMYLRWAERSGFETEIVNYQPGEGAGIKNATVLVRGLNAYGFLRSERGVHRLVRISPFDSNARRHT